MRDIKPYRDGFKDLKLPGKHKNMVSSLVHNHFRNKKADLNDREASHDSDIVRGKGKGLIVLLHGAVSVIQPIMFFLIPDQLWDIFRKQLIAILFLKTRIVFSERQSLIVGIVISLV